jgi:hypothetical protein
MLMCLPESDRTDRHRALDRSFTPATICVIAHTRKSSYCTRVSHDIIVVCSDTDLV